MELQPVKVGDKINAVFRGKLTPIECVAIEDRGKSTVVIWEAVTSPDRGHMPYDQWQKYAAAQAIAATKELTPAEQALRTGQKFADALHKISDLCRTVGQLEVMQGHSNTIRQAAADLRAIQQLVFKLTAYTGPEYPA